MFVLTANSLIYFSRIITHRVKMAVVERSGALVVVGRVSREHGRAHLFVRERCPRDEP